MEQNQQLDIIFFHGAYPLWKYLEQKFGYDIREVCDRVAKHEPKLETRDKMLTLQVVDKDYVHPLGNEYDSDVTFLLNCTNVVFNTLKEGIVRHGEHIFKPYTFKLDKENKTIYLECENTTEEETHEGNVSNEGDDVSGEEHVTVAKSLTDSIRLGVVVLSEHAESSEYNEKDVESALENESKVVDVNEDTKLAEESNLVDSIE